MRIRTLALAFSMLAFAGPALANCYETIGCDDSDAFSEADLRHFSCQVLWDLRNSIYKQNGYCFKTQRAISYFGNDGCYIADQGAVKLNAYERQNVAAIQSVEKAKGCN